MSLNGGLENFKKQFKILIDAYLKRNRKKTVIIFINDHIFSNYDLQMDGVMIFHLNTVDNHNIMIDDNVYNYDQNMVIEYLMNHWPTFIERAQIEDSYRHFLQIYQYPKITTLDDILIYTTAILFCQIMNMKNHYQFTGKFTPHQDCYKKFIDNLKI